jgi:hypothetical protein
MQSNVRNHGPAFAALETAERLSDPQIDARAHALLAQLSLGEKIKLMSGDYSFWKGMADMMGGGYNAHPWPAGEIPRLGIPGVRFTDGPRGVNMAGALPAENSMPPVRSILSLTPNNPRCMIFKVNYSGHFFLDAPERGMEVDR